MKFANEDQFVRWLKRKAPTMTQGMRLGIGDDGALVAPSPENELIVTNDMSIEDVHFSARLHPPEAIGHRALARSLSDVAAMGGTPRFALVALALSRQANHQWIELFLSGLLRLARRFRVAMLGGDTTWGARKTMVDIMVLGEVAAGKALLRSGARPGDQIYVAGEVGEAALGLSALRSDASHANSKVPNAVRAHLYPAPQCALGCFLAERRLATAAIDISDGLSTDLFRLCEASKVGASIQADAIPRPEMPSSGRWSPAQLLSFALNGGEDYKLLFTAPPAKAKKLPVSFRGTRLHRIGEISRSRALVLVDAAGHEKPLTPRGYDHFSRAR